MANNFELDFGFLQHYLELFCKTLEKSDPIYSISILNEICGRVKRDIPRMKKEGADEFKYAALFTFWIKKLKPIYVHRGQNYFLNEMFAFYFGFCAILKNKIKPGEPLLPGYKDLLKEIIYALRYRNINPHNLDLIYKAIYPKMVNVKNEEIS